jgi:hypothetical protein
VRNRVFPSGRKPNPWFAVLLLAALIARALVPLGYMPGPGGVMLCPAYAPLAAHIPNSGEARHESDMDSPGMDLPGMDMSMGSMDMSEHSGHGRSPSPHDGVAVCPFGAAASNVAITHTPLVLAVSAGASITPQPHTEQSAPRSTIPITRLPRGPPFAS